MRSRTLLAGLALVIPVAIAYAATRRDPAPASVPAAPPVPAAALPQVVPQAPTAAPAFQSGPADARIVLEEYSDFECPFCARSFLATGAGIEAFVARRGDIRYAFYDVAGPTHFHALDASIAARCAGAQGRYPAAQHLLFERQADWSAREGPRPHPFELVAPLVPDRAAFDACTDDQERIAAVLEANLERALGKGVQATPTLILITSTGTHVLRGIVDSTRLAAALK